MRRHPLRLAALIATTVVLGAASTASATGLLIPTDRNLDPLAVKHHRVSIDVTTGTATTTVEQVFVNHTSRPLEAEYVFPIPSDAVITDVRLEINGQLRKGEVLDKDRANQIYTEIVRRMRDPIIVDWMSSTLFRARIFPVPAQGTQRARITYSQVLPYLDGTYKISYPLKAPGKVMKTLEDFTLTATIDHTVPLKAIYSPTHRVSVSRTGETKAVVGFEEEKVALDKDFELYFGISKKDVGLNLLTYRPDPSQPGFYMLMAAPKATWTSQEIQGKAVTFVLDTSGSMTGAKLEHAKKALVWCLDRLGSDDRFNVVRFSTDVEQLSTELVAASSTNIDRAKRFVKDFEAAGGTAIDDALAAALKTKVNGAKHLVVFITDGRPTVGETELKAIVDRASKHNGASARLFTFGIGDDVNTHLLDKLAGEHGGASHYVKPNEAIETHVAALYNQIAFPVLTDIKLDIRNIRTFATLPGSVPDLFKGSQLLLIGRYRNDGDALVRLNGTLAGKAQQFDFEGTFPKERSENAFIAQLWAHRQVGFLLDQIRLNGESDALKQEVVQLAKKYGIVTPYTSYLVVEDEPTTAGLERPGARRPRPQVAVKKSAAAGSSAFAPAPMEDKAEAEAQVRRTAKSDDFRTQSGKDAVDQAKVVRRYKGKKVAESEVSTIRYAAGRAFRFDGKAWVDTALKAGQTVVKIAPFSAAWLELGQLRPDLKAALALGEQVTVGAGGLRIEVAPGGETELSAKTKAALKR